MTKLVPATKPSTRAKKQAKKKLSADEKRRLAAERKHKKVVRQIFANTEFKSINQLRDKQFTFNHVTSDFDDCFVFENVIVLLEYTITGESNIGDHVKGKQGVYAEIASKPDKFVSHLRAMSPDLDKALGSAYLPHQLRLCTLYASLNPVKSSYKQLMPSAKFLDYHIAKYFETVTNATRKSGRYEIFDFLGLKHSDVGPAVKQSSQNLNSDTFHGSILPEAHSNFGKGFKVVSFYASPAAILPRACVLRRYGWREGERAYQRLIAPKKISAIRTYLKEEKRVFINNIIATLPDSTKLLDEDGNTVDPTSIYETTPGRIQIPQAFNSVGLIDGQHRVYSYHEGGQFEREIELMRDQQNLLVTGIVFPPGMSELDKLKFEANLFLEINSTQSTAKSDLRQEIKSILHPFSDDAIARSVIAKLNESNGPLQDEFQRFDFETSKLKTSSIVSFALKSLVSDTGPILLRCDADLRSRFQMKESAAREDFVDLCVQSINRIFSAAKRHLPKHRWTADRKVDDRYLTTRNINAHLLCLKRVISEKGFLSLDEFEKAYEDLSVFDDKVYGSSHYNAMGLALYTQFF